MHKKTFIIKLSFISSLFLISACTGGEQPASATITTSPPIEIPTAEPTATLIHTPTPTLPPQEAWVGPWTLWVGNNMEQLEIDFISDRDQIVGVIEVGGGETKTFSAKTSEDGLTAIGTWISSNGQSGTLALLITEDKKQFIGNMDGTEPLCGARDGYEQPHPCKCKFGFDWSGEWLVWLGTEQIETILLFTQDGNDVGIRIYEFEGITSEDGFKLTGPWKALGGSGSFEAKMLDNMAQFTGNLEQIYPICGARLGAPKPEPCMGP